LPWCYVLVHRIQNSGGEYSACVAPTHYKGILLENRYGQREVSGLPSWLAGNNDQGVGWVATKAMCGELEHSKVRDHDGRNCGEA